jgi:hypothetical protein
MEGPTRPGRVEQTTTLSFSDMGFSRLIALAAKPMA